MDAHATRCRHWSWFLPSDFAPIPRAPFAIAMSVATFVALGAAMWAAIWAGATGMTLTAIASVVLAGGALCIVPLIGPPLVKPDNWGMVVLSISGARTLLGMGAMLVLVEAMDLDRKAVVYGLLAGIVTLMIAEATVAVWLLSARERAKAAARPATTSTQHTNQQHHGSLA